MNNNVNIEQGQLNFDWFTHYCVVTKRFDWLKDEMHILSLKRVRRLLMNIHEFRNTLVNLNSTHVQCVGNAHETRIRRTNTRAEVYLRRSWPLGHLVAEWSLAVPIRLCPLIIYMSTAIVYMCICFLVAYIMLLEKGQYSEN